MNTTTMQVEVYGNVGQLVMQQPQRPKRPGRWSASALSMRWPLRGMRLLSGAWSRLRKS